jgi:NTE family protein
MTRQTIGLILSGGGARGAYQVGVLRAIAGMLPQRQHNPFGIICGTSAGAINAASLASNADRFDRAVSLLARTWGNLHIAQVYRADLGSAVRSLLRGVMALMLAGRRGRQPVSLLDCTPLADLLGRTIDFPRIRSTIAAGYLSALCITASSYTSGDSINFFQSNGSRAPWRRARRVGCSSEIGLGHVLASCALPLFFPAVRIEDEHFGDGSMQQLAPISAAIHLGAQRVLVIGVGAASPRERQARDPGAWPSIAQIAGHLLDAIFVDTLDMDLERLERVNQTIGYIPEEIKSGQKASLRPIDTLVIRPSEPIAEIATAHADELPQLMRLVMSRVGVLQPNGARVLSYLLFERGYCRHLMRLGFSDAMAQRERILDFLGCDFRFRRKRGNRHSQEKVTSGHVKAATAAGPLILEGDTERPPLGGRRLRHKVE